MKFPGELKFPDLDHPGVPVVFHIEGSHAEVTLEGESLGRWSLYDVRADRLVASAFQVDLAGTEVTFVADDPIDFAYRGVEYMAQTWATMKGKKLGARGIAVNRSRKDTRPSRIDEVRAAMESNLENFEPRGLAGERSVQAPPVTASPAQEPASEPSDWDRRDQVAEIPSIGAVPAPAEPEPVPATPPAAADRTGPDILSEQQRLEDERRRLEEERAELARLRAEAEQREANLFEAYRLEMQRLEEERAAMREQTAGELAGAAAVGPGPEPGAGAEEPELEDVTEPAALTEEPDSVQHEMLEPEPETVPEPEPPREPEPVSRSVLDLIEFEEDELAEAVAAEDADVVAAMPDPADELPSDTPAADEPPIDEPPASEPPPEAPSPTPSRAPSPQPQPEPALAGASRERGGLMGAVKAAFRGGPKDHEHQFIEAPGGIGITRYVCEECGYVSISVAS